MTKLVAWTAKRSGRGLTVEGRDAATGQDVKLTGIADIGCFGGPIVARARNGREWELAA